MIDYTKISVLGADCNQVLGRTCLAFETPLNEQTGELRTEHRTAIFHSLIFEVIRGKYLNIRGSLHKFWNSYTGNGPHNWNDFTYEDFKDAISILCDLCDAGPDQLVFRTIEFGVNITDLPYKSSAIIQASKFYKSMPLDTLRGRARRRIGKKAVLQRYCLKLYDKGKQFSRPESILRIEIKVHKMVYLLNYDIKTVNDVLAITVWAALGRHLASKMNQLIYHEPGIKASRIQERDQLFWQMTKSTDYWEELHRTNRKTFERRRTKFRKIASMYLDRSTPAILTESILRKCTELTDIADIKHDSRSYRINRSSSRLERYSTPSRQDRVPVRQCKVCHRDISERRQDAIFCNSKRCRNADSNPRNNRRRKYGSYFGLPLFTL